MAEADIHSLIEGAYNTLEASGGESAEAVSGDVAVVDAGVAEAAPGVTAAPSDDGGSGESPPTKADRARDEKGKFAPKPKEAQALKPAASKTPAVAEGAVSGTPTADGPQLSEAVPAPVATRAPQGLTPAEREAFSAAPPLIQEALRRMDQTSRQALQESAPARQMAQAFRETISPYEGMLRAAGVTNPVQGVGQVMQQWATVQSGPLPQVASLIAQIIQSRGMPIDMLAQAIDGAPQGQQTQAQPQHFDAVALRQQIKQELMQDFQGQRQQHSAQQAKQTADAFLADPKNEFAEDVRDTMAALLSSGQAKDLAEAYESAIWSAPGIRDILLKRQKQEAAKAITASTQQARIAAASVKSTPSTGASSVKAPRTTREMVEAAYDATMGGGR